MHSPALAIAALRDALKCYAPALFDLILASECTTFVDAIGKLAITMGKHHRRAKRPRRAQAIAATVTTPQLPEAYRRASRLAAGGQYDEARRLYGELDAAASNTRLRALIGNDLAALDAVKGDFSAARQRLEAALVIDVTCLPARLNLELLINRLEATRGREVEAEATRLGRSLALPRRRMTRWARRSAVVVWYTDHYCIRAKAMAPRHLGKERARDSKMLNPLRRRSPCLGSGDISPCGARTGFTNCHYMTVCSPSVGFDGFRLFSFDAFSTLSVRTAIAGAATCS